MDRTRLETPSESTRASREIWPVVVLAIAALVFAPLLYVACFTQIEYYDTMDMLVNAKQIAYRAKDLHWMLNRTPLTSLLMVPAFLVERVTGVADLAVRAGHLFGVAYFAALLVVTYRLLRLDFDKSLAWLGVALSVLSPLMVHYAPMGREDILTCVLIVLAFHRYLTACRTRRRRDYYLCGVYCGFAMAMKYNLVPLLLVTIASYELIAGHTRFRPREMIWTKLIALLIVPACMFFLFPIIAFTLAGRADPWGALKLLIEDMQFLFNDLGRFQENPAQYFKFYVKCLTPPVALLSVWGIGLSLRKWPGHSLFFFLWLVIFFVFHADFISHKEARYLFALYAPAYYFALIAAGWIGEQLKRWPVARGLATAALLLAPAISTARELSRFKDPIYWADFERQVSRAAAAMAGPHRIVWWGSFYTIYPDDYLFDIEDEFTSMYHMSTQAIEVYTGKPAFYFLDLPVEFPSRDYTQILLDNPKVATLLRDGDVLVCNVAPFIDSRNVPALRMPLMLLSVQVIHLYPQFDAPRATAAATTESAESATTFRTRELDRAVIRVESRADGHTVRVESAPDGPALLLVGDAQRKLGCVVPLHIKDGTADAPIPPEARIRDVSDGRLTLVRLDRIEMFQPPGEAGSP